MTKKMKLVATLATLLIAAAGVMIFEACNKKENIIESKSDSIQNKGIVYLTEVADRESYIIDFEKKLLSCEKSDEVLTVENANSFMFDILNFDFCNINGNGCEISNDVSTYTLPVSNGIISLGDFATLYSQISEHIYNYYHSLNVINPHFYSIIPEIEDFDESATTTTVVVKSILRSGMAYRDFAFDSTLCDYFHKDEYQWEEAADTLDYCFNLEFPQCTLGSSERCYFTSRWTKTFYYEDYPDMLFHCGNCVFDDTYISREMMCVLLNNYIDLAIQYALAACVMGSKIIPTRGDIPNDNKLPQSIHHLLKVNYAYVSCTNLDDKL